MKAMAKASSAGQRIYRITHANQATVLPLIQHDASTLNEIRSALAAGRVVITHTNSVSVLGWTGAGYVLLEPDIGSAAWKISGGANGGFMDIEIDWSLLLTLLVAPLLAALSVLAIPTGILALALGLTVLARVAAVAGFLLGQLAGLAGFDRLTLAISRMIVTTILVFGLLAFGPTVVIAPIALQLFIMMMVSIFVVELALAIFLHSASLRSRRHERFA